MTAFIEGIFFQQFWGQALAVLADSGIKGVVLLALAFLITLSLRRGSAAARHLVWALALSALCLLPILSLILPKWQLPILPRTVLTVIPARAMIFPLPPIVPQEPRSEISPATPAGPLETVGPSEKPISRTTARQSAARPLPISFWLVSGWFMVTLAALVPLLAGFVLVGRLVRQARRLEHDPWPALLRSLSERLGLRRRMRVLRTNGATMPMSVGVWRPTILLPKEVEEWTEEKRRAVLLHELAHVKRRDCLTHVLSRLACAVHWFNPLAWAGFRKLQAERERACDDLVLSAGARAGAYADQLLEIARTMHAKAFTSAAAITMARRSQLEGRLLAILDATRNRRYLKPRSIFVGLCAALCLIVPLAMAQISERKKPTNLPPHTTASPSGEQSISEKTSLVKTTLGKFQTALISFRIDNQRYPGSLSQLTTPIAYLSAIPQDPFRPDRPYQYLTNSDGTTCTVYSVGAADAAVSLDKNSKINQPRISAEENQRRWDANRRELTLQAIERSKALIKERGGVLIPPEDEVLRRLENRTFYSRGYGHLEDSLFRQIKSSYLGNWDDPVIARNIFIDERLADRPVRGVQIFCDSTEQNSKDLLHAFGLEGAFFEVAVPVYWIPQEAAKTLPKTPGPAFSENLANIKVILFQIRNDVDFDILADKSLNDYALPQTPHIEKSSDGYLLDGKTYSRDSLVQELEKRWKISFRIQSAKIKYLYVYDPRISGKDEVAKEFRKALIEQIKKQPNTNVEGPEQLDRTVKEFDSVEEQPGERKNPTNPPPHTTASLNEDNPLGLSDDVLKKLFETGQSMRLVLTAVQSYRIDNQRVPEKMEDLLKPVDYLGKVPSDPFGSGPLRLVIDPVKAPDKVRVYSVGPDGKWDDGKTIDSSDSSLAGDLGAELDIKTGRVRFLADPTFTMYLEGKRLSHYLASKAEESAKPAPATPPENVSRATTRTLVWGPEVNGLRAALELVPEQEAYALGQVVGIRFHVRNVSRRAIQLAGSDTRQDEATIKDASGKRIAGNHQMFTAWGTIVRRTLQPGETAVFKGYGLGIGIAASEPKPGSVSAGNILDGPPGKYTVTYSLRVPDVTRISARDPKESVPQPEDWQGMLVTGAVEVAVKSAALIVLELDNERMPGIADRIRWKYGIRVCFEEVDYEIEKDVVRLGEFIQEMEAAAKAGPLSPAQKKRLEIARGYMKEGKSPGMPFDLKFFPYSGVYSATTIEGLLDKLTEKGPYTWKRISRSYVVYPRERSVLDFPVSVDLRDVSLQDAVNKILAQSPEPNKIGMMVTVTGPVEPRYLDARIRGSLRVQNSPAMYVLTQAVEYADSKVCWEIAGYKGQRTLGLVDVPDTREPGGIAEASIVPKPGDVDTVQLGGGVKMELVWVPAGSFQMGSPDSEAGRTNNDEGPVHTVELEGFWMGKFEVAQEQYEAVTGKNPSDLKGPKKPVEMVSWNDAADFCRKLTDRVGRASSPASVGRTFRLPTEAEWEYACRAGSSTRFCFGDSDGGLGDYAWYDGNSGKQTQPVGERKPNAWGLYDMHGNVWEWCGDRPGEKHYDDSDRKDPQRPSSDGIQMLRGGSWRDGPGSCRSASRNRGDSRKAIVNSIGFRVVVSPTR